APVPAPPAPTPPAPPVPVPIAPPALLAFAPPLPEPPPLLAAHATEKTNSSLTIARWYMSSPFARSSLSPLLARQGANRDHISLRGGSPARAATGAGREVDAARARS